MKSRLLFCSFHCLYDTASGAATSARDLLNLLEYCGWDWGVVSGPRLDFDDPLLLSDALKRSSVNARQQTISGPAGQIPIWDVQGNRPAVILDGSTDKNLGVTPNEARQFLDLVAECAARWKPDVVLTYGGGSPRQGIMSFFKTHGIPIVFWLRNHSYHDAEFLHMAEGAIVPSEFTRELYQRRLGVDAVALPPPLDFARLQCRSRKPQFVTFVNPQPRKGLALFVAIAHALAKTRPDIPLLVVEGIGGAEFLAEAGLTPQDHPNIHIMPHTPDARQFYALTKLLLVPSTAEEPSSRVAAEAQINGIPVIGSRRGGLPETIGDGGFIIDVPTAFLPSAAANAVPTPHETAPWVDAIIRLWDDANLYAEYSRRAFAMAETRKPERLGPLYDAYFRRIIQKGISA